MADAIRTWAPAVPSSPAAPVPAASFSPTAAGRVPDESEAREFAEQLNAINLRHIVGLTLIGLVAIAGTFILNLTHPLPLRGVVDYTNALLAVCGGISLALVAWFRRRVVSLRGRELFVATFTILLLGSMNVYFFTVLPGYGQTSIYVLGMTICALLIRLPPATFFSLLAANHAVFLTVLFRLDLDASISGPAATDNSAMMLMAGLASWLLYRAQRDNFRKERVITQHTLALHARNEELARLHRLEADAKLAARLGEEKARLEMLRYQLNPHFLFNAFTSIRSQLPPSLTAARTTIERLTDFCQLTLFQPKDGEHPTFADEIKLLRAYLDIEQTRWAELLSVEIDVSPDVGHHRIPSLLLLPLVENALKYGRATRNGPMVIRLTACYLETDTLLLEVANTGDWGNAAPTSAAPSLGIGLENLRQRLTRYYPGRHEFATMAREGWVTVSIRLHLAPC